MRRPSVAVLLFIVCAGAARAADEVQVRLSLSPAAAACTDRGAVVATAANDDRIRVASALRAGQSIYRLSLPNDDGWTIRVEAPECWSEPATWISSLGNEVSVGVYRQAVVAGVFEGEARPQSLQGVIFPAGAAGAAGTTVAAATGVPISCTLEYPRWTCVVPAEVSFDLRLDAPRFASVYFWSVLAPTGGGPRNLASQPLHPGGSLAGWVRDASDIPVANARISVYPLEAETRQQNGMAARRRTAMTNARGFFQVTGLPAAQYRLVSEAEGMSPVRVPEIRIRGGEAVVWPRPITHPPFATLDLSVYPAVDLKGKPWTVTLTEKAKLHAEPQLPRTRTVPSDGRWVASNLRADVYELLVRNDAGSVVESVEVDLSEGGTRPINLTVRSIVVRGFVNLDGEGLEADVTFNNLRGKYVMASADEDGRFEAAFPVPGRWIPQVRYPAGTGSTLELEEITITDEPQDLQLDVPGGRIRGTVVNAGGDPEAAAVHVVRNAQPVAQVITGDDGKFDLIGIKAGAYVVGAQGKTSATATPLPVDLAEDETKEMRLVLEPHAFIKGTILAPNGAPASGAVVHVSTDQLQSWRRVVTDVDGRFEQRVPAGVNDAHLVILTYTFPSTAVRLSRGDFASFTVSLKPAGGILRVRNAGYGRVRMPHVAVPLTAFRRDPRGPFDGVIHLEPGTYAVCPNREVDATCRTVTIVAGTEVEVDFKSARQENAP